MRQPFLVTFAAIALTAVACSKQPAPPPAEHGAGAPAAAAPAAAAPPAAPASAGSQGSTLSGTVLETMDAASYTYVRVKSGESAVWAAAPQFPVKVGDRVTVPLEMPMKDFHSQALNRDFPLIYFVSKIAREGETVGSSAAAPTMMSGHGTSAPSEPPPALTEPIPQPAGGTTIADVWAKRKALDGKQVTVRGRVVKFNPGILGKDWIHLQDGTGKAEDRTNDITVMAAEGITVKVGDTVTLAGTVVLDKDLGSGYVYATAIDNARLVARQ